MANISEIASQLKDALETSQQAHKALEDAKAKLIPLEAQAEQADSAVNSLMLQYQHLTSDVAPVARRRGAGGAGKKRGPRPFSATALTTASRILKASLAEGTTKEKATKAVLERCRELGTVTAEIEAAIKTRANEIFKK